MRSIAKLKGEVEFHRSVSSTRFWLAGQTCEDAQVSIEMIFKRPSTFVLLAFSILQVLVIVGSGNPLSTLTTSNDYYVLEMDLPPEIIYDVIITDTLPSGLIYDSTSFKAYGATTAPIETISSSNDGSQPVHLSWAFNQVDNSEDQDLLIEFKTFVADVASNKDGTTLNPCKVSLSWKDAQGESYSVSGESRPVVVVEPDLELKQSLPPIGALGDIITCSISIRHTPASLSDAFNVDVVEALPQGLTYSPGSMELVSGPDCISDNPQSNLLHWHFDKIDQSWIGDKEIILRFKAVISDPSKTGDTLESRATLHWASIPDDNPGRREYSKISEDRIIITSKQSNLSLSMEDYPDPVSPGGYLNYSINYRDNSSITSGTIIEAAYGNDIAFLSSDPAPDQGTNNRWTLGNPMMDDSGIINIMSKVNPSVSDGAAIESSAKISSENGASAQAKAATSIKSKAPLLLIDKSASRDIIRPGGSLNYLITYSNEGNVDATNVSITDIIDKNLNFNPNKDSTPAPTESWRDEDGIHLWWDATALNSRVLEPGSSGNIKINVIMPSASNRQEVDKVINRYKIDSDQTFGEFNTLETFVVHSLFVRKKAGSGMYSAGDIINYTITYGNELAINAENAVVTDILPNVDYLGADPEPSSIKGNILTWNIGTIRPHNNSSIKLDVMVKENKSEIKFEDNQSVSGEGYVSFSRRLSTSHGPDTLTNYVNITAYYLDLPENDSSSSSVRLRDAIATEASIQGHGSGTYRRDDRIALRTEKKVIQINTNLSTRYKPTLFKLPCGRSMDFVSRWSEGLYAKNYVTGASLSESYAHATRIDHEGMLKEDLSGTTLETDTSFEGAGKTSLVKKTQPEAAEEASIPEKDPNFESREDYLGSFKIQQKLDESGTNVETNRSVSGFGFVVTDKRIGKSQRIYESGTGNYQADDQIQTLSSYMDKGISAQYHPMNYSYTPSIQVSIFQKWKQGIWSRTGVSDSASSAGSGKASFIGEEFSSADFLNDTTIARGLNELDTEADFSGKAEFKAIYGKGNFEKDISNIGTSATKEDRSLAFYDEYSGRYKITRKVLLSGVSKFNGLHINLTKIGKVDLANSTFADYTIIVENDGNRALGPVYVLDIFPPGTQYISSSARPSELNSSYAKWTLLSLGIGTKSTIDLRLNITQEADNVINIVKASGTSGSRWVSAENFSATELNWLTCMPPEIYAKKVARIDPNNTRLVEFTLILQNREKSDMVAQIMDQLPDGMEFLNFSQVPDDNSSGQVLWTVAGLKPKEVKEIHYWARVLRDGIFVNQAHVEASFMGRSGSVSVDLTSRIEAGEGSACQSLSRTSGTEWQPPQCFGLNCTQQDLGKDWAPCYTCGVQEQQPMEAPCSSCISTAEDNSLGSP